MNFQYDKWDSISDTERESKIGILNGNGWAIHGFELVKGLNRLVSKMTVFAPAKKLLNRQPR